MATYRNSHALAASQARRFARLERSIKIAHKDLADKMMAHAQDQTSGPISSKQLAAMGHPFGRGAGRITAKGKLRVTARGSAPLLPINKQSGELKRSWRLFRRNTASGQMFQLQPTSPHAIVLRPGGTKKMVARGFWTMMKTEFKKQNRVTVQRMRYLTLLEMRKAG